MAQNYSMIRQHKFNGETISSTDNIVANTMISADFTVPPATTNGAYSVSIPITAMQSFFLVSSQPVTVKTNSTSSPGNTFTLAAGIALDWALQDGFFANPVSVAIATLYITNAGSVPALVQVRAGEN